MLYLITYVVTSPNGSKRLKTHYPTSEKDTWDALEQLRTDDTLTLVSVVLLKDEDGRLIDNG